MVNVRKRGNVYEYNFNVAKIEGKRKRMKMVDGILEQQKLKVEKDQSNTYESTINLDVIDEIIEYKISI